MFPETFSATKKTSGEGLHGRRFYISSATCRVLKRVPHWRFYPGSGWVVDPTCGLRPGPSSGCIPGPSK